MKRYFNLVTGTFLVLGLLVFVAGCSDSGTTWADIESGGDDDDGVAQEMSASKLKDGRRGIGISFPEAIPESIPEASVSKADAPAFTRDQVEALMSVEDSQGRDKQINSVNWSPDGKYASVFGEFPYCAALTLKVLTFMADGSDFVATATMPKAPGDINGDCKADVPVYDELPQMIYVFEGPEAMDLSVPRPSTLSLADIDPTDYWSYQMAVEGNRGVINLGDVYGDGVGVFAAVDSKFHQLHIWQGLASEDPVAIWNFELGDLGMKVGPPISIGNINGKGGDDFAFSDLMVDENGELILDPDSGKPIAGYYYVLGGDLASYDYGWQAAAMSYVPDNLSDIKGQCGYGAGNLNGDISSAGYPLGDVAVCFTYTSYQEVVIGYGVEDFSAVSDLPSSSIINVSEYRINDVALADFDGNGVDDIAMAMSNKTVGELDVRVFLNENGSAAEIGDVSASSESMKISDTYDGAFENEVFSPGDINGDGFDELVVISLVVDETAFEHHIIYLFFGREAWPGDLSVANADIVIENGGIYPDNRFKSIIRVGDLDNDGYDELAVNADSRGTAYTYIYRGRPLMKKSLDVKEDPSAIVIFSGK